MAVTCHSCGADAPEGARFCPSCGSALVTGPARERKFATALFADVVGSTALGEQQDPEIVQDLVARVFDRMTPVVERYGGLVDNYMGDAILAVFGVPQVHEDDPERAVRAALELRDVLSGLNRSFAEERRPRLHMRIALESGEVLVDGDRPDRRVTGDPVNVAARLQAAAEPGTIVVGPSAHASTYRAIDYEPLPALELKGKAELVPAWRALRVKARLRGERPVTGLRAQLVGREDELAILRQSFQRSAREGRSSLITILGPAGTGKSRLVRDFYRYLDGLETVVYWREGRCLAYGNVSYSALADSIKAHCELLEDDSADAVESKVERAVSDLFEDEGPLEEMLALVGVSTHSELAREQLFEGWRRFLERMAQRHPLVLAWEDIHWADAGLMDFIEHLADWAQGPILILTMARPELLEVRPLWGGGRRNYTSIYLDPLTSDESRTLLDDLAGGALPDSLAEQIVEHAEGNPLYTEEIVQMLLDRGVLERTEGSLKLAQAVVSVDVPRSVQTLIAARIDGLRSEEKGVLQDAAVVGRTAWTGAVAALGDRSPDEARRLMGALRVRDLLIPSEPSTFSGDTEFWFRHVLIRDVAYQSIAKRDRAAKHRAAAEWAESRVGSRSEELAELIATHYLQALTYLAELGTDDAESAEIRDRLHTWATRAGQRAESLGQLEEAARWYRTAIEASPAETGDLDRARLWESYARVGSGTEPVDQVIEALQQALDVYETLQQELDAGRVESQLGLAVWYSGQDSEAESWIDKGVSRLADLEPGAELADALSRRGNFLWRHERNQEAEEDLRRAIELAEGAGDSVTLIRAQHDLGISLAKQGRYEEAMPLIEESYEAAATVSDLQLRLRIATNWGAYLVDYLSEARESAEILRFALTESRKAGAHGHAAWHANNLGGVLADLGDLEEATEHYLLALRAAEAIDYPLVRRRAMWGMATVMLWQGDVSEARRLIDRVDPHFEDEEAQHVRDLAIFLIELAAAERRHEDALQVTRQALAMLPGPHRPASKSFEFAVEAIRVLVEAGELEEAMAQRDAMVAGFEPPRATDAYVAWADGLLATGAMERVSDLERAVDIFDRRELRIPLVKALIDLADAQVEAGIDPESILQRARRIAAECGVGLYVAQIEERLGTQV